MMVTYCGITGALKQSSGSYYTSFYFCSAVQLLASALFLIDIIMTRHQKTITQPSQSRGRSHDTGNICLRMWREFKTPLAWYRSRVSEVYINILLFYGSAHRSYLIIKRGRNGVKSEALNRGVYTGRHEHFVTIKYLGRKFSSDTRKWMLHRSERRIQKTEMRSKRQWVLGMIMEYSLFRAFHIKSLCISELARQSLQYWTEVAGLAGNLAYTWSLWDFW